MGWTKAQEQCIKTRGGTVLVSAAAGSGKTTVLVERVTSRIADKTNPVDIDRLLIVTYTKAAAAEMKQRLANRIASSLQENPDNGHLARQQMLLPSAQISTIHGFCVNFLRENFEAAGIPPRFTIADDNTISLLKAEALDETLEYFYTTSEDGFIKLCKVLNGNARNDKKIRERVLDVYEAIQSQPFPLSWLRKACATPDVTKSLLESTWGERIRKYAKEKLLLVADCVEKEIAPLATMEESVVLYTNVKDYPGTLRNEACVIADPANGWDVCKGAVAAVWPPTLKGASQADPVIAKALETMWKWIKEQVLQKDLQMLFRRSEAEEKALLQETAPMMQALVGLVEMFSERFAAKKLEQACLDFGDLEHFTLRLLCDEETDMPTALARETAEKFDEIYVDEYQDTNQAQDTIFRMLSCANNSSFFVGDVKQCIYGFRQANPQNFIKKKEDFFEYDGEHFPACIPLDKNFRSREEVTKTVNFVCEQVMTKAFCGIDYTDGEQLQHGATDVEESVPVEILLSDDTFAASELKAETLEARIVAERIEDLIKNGWVTAKDKKTDTVFKRPVEYRDICILLRGRATRPFALAAALEEKSIPVQKDKALPLLDADEVNMALCFLRVVDNPLLDIPLMTVMLSSTVGFTADECAQIRIFACEADADKLPLYSALLAAEKGIASLPLREKITAFLTLLQRYRRLAATMGAEEFINRLYDDTGMLLAAAADTDGIQKVANLRGLTELARGFERNGFRGLSAFVRYIDRLESEHAKLEAPQPAGQANAVTIMTIHGSKGLEFPVVILANMTKKIRKDASTEVFCLHNEGAAVCAYDQEEAAPQRTALFEGMELAKRYTDFAEEARLLYVALTRAKDRLICVYADYKLETYLQKLAKYVSRERCISTAALMQMGSVGEWLLTALFRHPKAHVLRTLGKATDVETLEIEAPLEVKWLDAAAYLDMDDAAEQETAQQDTQTVSITADKLYERMAYTYAYAPLSAIPVKVAASELAHRDIGGAFVATCRPAFLSDSGMTPAERGTALHAFMQLADFDAAAKDPAQEAQRLCDEGFLSAAEKDALDMTRIRAFFAHPLYGRLQKADAVWREYAFTVPLSVAALDPSLASMAEETLIVQGMADCVFEEEGALVIVDYKTDRVKDAVTLQERYKKQLEIYRNALEQTLGKPVKETLLYAFQLDDTVTV